MSNNTNAPIPAGMSYAQAQAIIVQLRRQVMAAMETGQEGIARTIITELREYDFQAATRLRAEVVKAYGTDL